MSDDEYRIDNFSKQAQSALELAFQKAQQYRQSPLDVEHIVLALFERPDEVLAEVFDILAVNASVVASRVAKLLRGEHSSSLPPGGVGNVAHPVTPQAYRALRLANKEVEQLGDRIVSTEHLLLAIISQQGAVVRILSDEGVTRERVVDALSQVDRSSVQGSSQKASRGSRRFKTLEKYSRDLTELASEGKLDPVIGRDVEIQRVLQVLSRRTKNNPVLIGEAGVGKTAIVEGLAQAIAEGDVPEPLMNKRIVSLMLGAMVAGSRFRGEFEERLQATLDEISQAQGEIILFIDELHTVAGAGGAQGAIDASSMMKPALARGELWCIGATTLDEYRQHIETDSALERRFAPIYVEEPSLEETIAMLKGLRSRYEEHHHVRITDDALEAAAQLSDRYVKDRHLPDKAIDLMDEAGSRLRIRMFSLPDELKALRKRLINLAQEEEQAAEEGDYRRKAEITTARLRLEQDFREQREAWQREQDLDEVVDVDEIAEIVSMWTGIPVARLQKTETTRLLEMEEALSKRVVGQKEAIEAVSDAIRRARSGLKDPRRPIGSFIFLGSSGVGKTELAKALAEFLFDDEDALLSIDMTEYGERHTVSRLVGSPPGYVGYDEGGQLTEAVRRRPYRVILFDEIEKAHPDVWNALMQILEEGRLTDGHGRTVDFRNAVVIMTSNIGTRFAARRAGVLGFRTLADEGEERERYEDELSEALKKTFRPEFLNRVDEVIIFNELDHDDIIAIVQLQMEEIRERLNEQGLSVILSEEAKSWLAKRGYDPQFGARPVRRVLQRYVESPLSRRLLAGEFEAGDIIQIDVNADEDALEFSRRQDDDLRPAELEEVVVG
ncbi:MAG: ATP-dependent Clp protease ATP-binding subunit [Anaerolineae bacterium]